MAHGYGETERIGDLLLQRPHTPSVSDQGEAIAEFERAIMRERVIAGLRAAKTNGVKLGRPETLAKHLPAVSDLLKQGLGVRAIARELGVPTSSAFELVKQGCNGEAQGD